jgi:predicted phage terminase large subunit-like protein
MGEVESAPGKVIIGPQPGPQTAFLSTSADIAIYGGAAGGGKTFGELLEPTRHVHNPAFGAVVFRRTTPQITNEGGLWDESLKLYPLLGAKPNYADLYWRFPSGAAVSFSHLEHDKTVLNWQGSQIPLICFDELTHFTQKQFWYMVSRNRSMSGIRGYIRATCNPDADSWVAELIAWWINQDTGYPIPERAGVLRWFVRIGDKLIWADQPQDLAEYVNPVDGLPIPPKSLTFIPAKLSDNLALMAADPGYLANLMALPLVERERLLGGNWKIRAAAGLLFRRGWTTVVEVIPAGTTFVRGWDLAATPKTDTNDPDWTTGTKIGKIPDGRFIVAHHVRMRGTPREVERLLVNTASADGRDVRVALPQDPAQAGKSQAQHLISLLAGYEARCAPASGDKITRFGAFSAQAEAGNVLVLRGPWNEDWFTALESFPPATSGGHDDDADSTSEAFNELIGSRQMTVSAEAAAEYAALARNPRNRR